MLPLVKRLLAKEESVQPDPVGTLKVKEIGNAAYKVIESHRFVHVCTRINATFHSPQQKKDFDGAVDAWYEALKLDLGQHAVLGNLSALCLMQNRYHECRWLCKKALARITNSVENDALNEELENEMGPRYINVNFTKIKSEDI